jgi:asparagine synthetase B (glutamine-hydrolysing)
VRPATHVVIDRDGARHTDERYWSWTYEPQADRPANDVLAAFDETLSAVVTDHARRGRLVVPLSGGLDSRTVFAVATRDHPDRVSALTYGYWPESPEIRIPRALAATRATELRELVVPEYVFDRLDTVLDAVEGFSALCFTRQIGALDGFAAGGERIVGAHWGDVWFDDFGASALHGDALTDRAFGLFSRPGGDDLQSLLRLGPGDHAGALRELVETELARVPDLGDPDLRIKALKTEQWSARWTIPGTCAYRAALPLALPFYDNRLVDFYLTVPTEVVSGRRLQVEYLRRHHPDLAAVPWEATGRSLLAEDGSAAGRTARRVVDKIRRSAARTPTTSRNWEVQYRSPAARAEVARRLDGLPDDLVDSAAVARLHADWQHRPTGSNGYEIDMLVTLAAMLPRLGPPHPGNV